MTDDDSAPLFAILGRAEISRFDPPLMSIRTPYPPPPLPAFSHPLVQRAAR